MKQYFDSWKKFLAEGLAVDAAKEELALIQKGNLLRLQLAQTELANATALEKAEKDKIAAIEKSEKDKITNPENNIDLRAPISAPIKSVPTATPTSAARVPVKLSNALSNTIADDRSTGEFD